MRSKETLAFVLFVGTATVVACSGGSGTTSSSGSTSSSSSSSSSSGNVTQTTTCSPKLDGTFFATAREVTDALLETRPCPTGFRSAPEDFPDSPRPLDRITTQEAFTQKYCVESDAGVVDAGAGVDFGTEDVVVLEHSDRAGQVPLLDVGGELWLRTKDSQCGGAGPSYRPAFYVVSKGREVKVESCVTTCTCGNGPCLFP